MWACMLASVGVLASGAYAQQRSPVTIIGPVRQGYDDVGPLSRSLSQPAADLRTPMDFDRVYRVQTGVDFFGRPREMYARAAGGLTAVFPQSSYISTRGGMEPEVPAGTVWIIGAPQDPSRMSGVMPGFQPARGLAPGEFDGRVDMRIPMEADGRNTRPDVSRSHALADTRTIWTSEIYRQQRLTHLLDRAAGPAVRPQ
jgi:hypothetical protein